MSVIEQYKELGEQWMDGAIIEEVSLNGKDFKFTPKQIEFINAKDRYTLISGGYGSGKTLAMLIKLILFGMMFPGNRILLGRKTLSDIERALLPDLFELLPKSWYDHRVKDAVINLFNGSQIILFGLDALQSGSEGDIKKAEQKIKSLNLGSYFIDQLEEVEYSVFHALNGRLRRTNVPIRQGNMTTNPANYWGYQFFKLGEKFDGKEWTKVPDNGGRIIEGSMMDNKANLPEDYIADQLNNPKRYVDRYVYGIWSPDVLTDKVVFAEEYIKRFGLMKRSPKETREGCEIYEIPAAGEIYQMGVDPSEGSVDPSSITVIDSHGSKVAKFNGYTTIPGLIEKVKFLYYTYNKPLIVPEVNAAGQALLEGIKDLKIYKRQQFEYRTQHTTEKLGFKTSHQSKQSLISHFQDLLRKGFPKIYDAGTIQEMKTFVWSDEAKRQGAGAQRGYHDDDVMSTLLAYWGVDAKSFVTKKIARSRPKQVKKFQYR